MRLDSPRALLASAAVLAATAVLLAAAPPGSTANRSAAASARHTTPRTPAADTLFTASLSGKNEVPGPGSANGSGSASIRIEPTKGLVCFALSVTGLHDVTAAHIHHAAAGRDGPPVVMLRAPKTGKVKGCAPATPSIITLIMEHPADFYVNVHDKAHPAGALRGQLVASGK